jgi:hypothetical protein
MVIKSFSFNTYNSTVHNPFGRKNSSTSQLDPIAPLDIDEHWFRTL